MHHQSISMHPWYIEAAGEGGGESTTILSVTTEDDERPVPLMGGKSKSSGMKWSSQMGPAPSSHTNFCARRGLEKQQRFRKFISDDSKSFPGFFDDGSCNSSNCDCDQKRHISLIQTLAEGFYQLTSNLLYYGSNYAYQVLQLLPSFENRIPSGVIIDPYLPIYIYINMFFFKE